MLKYNIEQPRKNKTTKKHPQTKKNPTKPNPNQNKPHQLKNKAALVYHSVCIQGYQK